MYTKVDLTWPWFLKVYQSYVYDCPQNQQKHQKQPDQLKHQKQPDNCGQVISGVSVDFEGNHRIAMVNFHTLIIIYCPAHNWV